MSAIIALSSIGLIFNVSLYSNYSCEDVAEGAYAIMKYRQSNGDFSSYINKIQETGEEKGILTYLAIKAYETPLYTTDEFINKTIMEFKNNEFLRCLKSK